MLYFEKKFKGLCVPDMTTTRLINIFNELKEEKITFCDEFLKINC